MEILRTSTRTEAVLSCTHKFPPINHPLVHASPAIGTEIHLVNAVDAVTGLPPTLTPNSVTYNVAFKPKTVSSLSE